MLTLQLNRRKDQFEERYSLLRWILRCINIYVNSFFFYPRDYLQYIAWYLDVFIYWYLYTGCSLNIVFFLKSCLDFLNSACSGAALMFYLPGVCTNTDTEGKQRKNWVRNILKSLEKTQYLMNTLYQMH